MITNKDSYRFSGHDTFHCKEQWILKGIQLVDSEGDVDIFKDNKSIYLLGVGKNMVRSIHYWLKAFGILNEENQKSKYSDLLFSTRKFDPYLENEGSLWLLQYYLCKTNYSSIFQLIFSKYFSDKATLEFSEYQILSFIKRLLKESNQKEVATKTLNSDFKVFIRTYVTPAKNEKNLEDDFNAPLLSLELVSDTGRKNNANQRVYRLNRRRQEGISIELFAYFILVELAGENSIKFDKLRKTIGSYLCLSNEGLEILIDKLCESNNNFNYKDDAGIRQLQIKEQSEKIKDNLLKKHYED